MRRKLDKANLKSQNSLYEEGDSEDTHTTV